MAYTQGQWTVTRAPSPNSAPRYSIEGPHDGIFSGERIAIQLTKDNADRIIKAINNHKALVEFVEGEAAFSCCQSPGCSRDEPCCAPMQARALLAELED